VPTLTAVTLDSRADAQRRLVAAQSALAGRVIATRLDDVAAHAEKAITETLRQTPDGRATAARLKRSRSYLAACDRLSELRSELTAYAAACREAAYRNAYDWWYERTPDHVRRPGVGITRRNVSQVRGVYLHGTPLSVEVGAPVLLACRRLAPALTQAASLTVARYDATDKLAAWRATAQRTIAAAVGTAISDGATAAERKAARDCIAPEFLHDDPLFPVD
jgi:hypothetical protein